MMTTAVAPGGRHAAPAHPVPAPAVAAVGGRDEIGISLDLDIARWVTFNEWPKEFNVHLKS